MDYLWDNKHFILTHFPIVLLIFGFLLDLAGLIWKKREWNNAGLVCLIAGTLGAIASVLTGPESPNPNVEEHEMYGRLTMFLAIAISVVRLSLLWAKKKDFGSHPVFLVAALAAAVMVGYTGHLGGEMVHRSPGDFPGGGFGGPGMQQGGQFGQDGQGGQNGQGGQAGQNRQGGQTGQGEENGDNGGQAPASSPAANP